MEIRGSSRLTVIYHFITSFLLIVLLLPGVFGNLVISEPEIGLPCLFVAVLAVQCATLWWFNKNVASTFSPKDVSIDTYSRCACSVLLSTLVFHVTFVLFGAPVFDDIVGTFLLACFVTSLAVLPVAVCTDCSAAEIDRLFFRRKSENVVERSLLYIVSRCIIGCWLGALPIPLDWDEPWQRWPITCVTLAIGGVITGHIEHATRTIVDGRPESREMPKGKKIRA